jgi:hypothetical protein
MPDTQHATHNDHPHAHGEGCGHVAFPHDGHTDYADERHVHRVHGDHVDECAPTGHVTHEAHAHEHGPQCGHVAVPHEGHTDYLHDGHRHAAHDGHWDEH